MLWSDPVDNDTGALEVVYKNNEVRGCAYYYGKDAVKKFLDKNRLLSVIRAHEV